MTSPDRSETAHDAGAELARERRRSADAVLLARLSEQAARDSERELAAVSGRLRDLERENGRLAEALAGHAPSAISPGTDELERLRAERDAAVREAQRLTFERRVDGFAIWLLQRRVALGLMRRGRGGATAALGRAAAAADLSSIPEPALRALAGPRTVLALQMRRSISGLPRALEAVRYRLGVGTDLASRR